mmetsp:Transcript_2837/g.4220  ORF Transcript_2837/g.4220 Transcript_2837/m.4220 type:complete len:139 (-) Transcript_2837:604-1020(-)
MWHTIHASVAITTVTESNRHAILAKIFVAYFAYFQILTLNAEGRETHFAYLHSTAILTKLLPTVLTETCLAVLANMLRTLIASVALQPPIRTVFGLIHPHRGFNNIIALDTQTQTATLHKIITLQKLNKLLTFLLSPH